VQPPRDRTITWIAVLKLIKASALVVLGVLGLVLAPQRLVDAAERHLGEFHPGRRLIEDLFDRVWNLGLGKEKALAAVSLLYAAVFFTEGVGLLLRRRWAEWLTVVVTGSFIPLEIYEVAVHFGAWKMLTLLINVAIVVYLVRRRVAARSQHEADARQVALGQSPR
jgi:uncharacterized membrane protein (DUF2068 family)